MATELREHPRNTDDARDEIERTRARMSETIDEIEETLLRKRDDIRERLDVGARLRDRPLAAVGVALGAGLLLGLLTGGAGSDKRREREENERREREEDERRARDDEREELWEQRARRLLAIGRKQQRRIDRLESSIAKLERRARDDDGERIGARLTEFGSGVAERIEEAAAATAKRFRESVLRDG